MEKKYNRYGKSFTAGQGNYRYCSACNKVVEAPIIASYKKEKVIEEAPEHMKIVQDADQEKSKEMIKSVEDMVNHPPHYQLPNGVETKEILKQLLTPEEYRGWCKGNTLKYQFRAGKKDPDKEKEDYSKAQWFLNELKESM